MSIEKLIVSQLLKNESYSRKVLPHFKKEWFAAGTPERVVFELIDSYIHQYDAIPPADALEVDLLARKDLNEKTFTSTVDLLALLNSPSATELDTKWMLDRTLTFCRDAAFNLVVAQILDEEYKNKLDRDAIPRMFEEANAIDFDDSLGHDYFEDARKRFEYYHDDTARTPTNISVLNEVLKGGWLPGTLNIVMAVSGAGKSLFMCSVATDALMQGKNVLYISLELSEIMAGHRIDANLMDTDMGEMRTLTEHQYFAKIEHLKSKTIGRFKFKQYAPNSAGVAHFRAHINELRTKQGFVPDLICVDYINICAATSLNSKGVYSMYDKVKRAAEDIRGLAIELNVPIISATQTNRGGYGDSDPGMDNVSESIGLPQTADWMAAIFTDDQLKKMRQYKFIQLKSRYDDAAKKRVFYVGVDSAKQKLFNLEQSGQDPMAGFNIPKIDSPIGFTFQ
jgi:replicative DNA helicase